MFLQADGLDQETVEAALRTVDPEPERAQALVGRLGRTAKAAAQLQRKGFGADSLESAFGDLFAEGGDAA